MSYFTILLTAGFLSISIDCFAGEHAEKREGAFPPLCWKTVEITSDGNAVFALDAETGKPCWNDSGLFYREAFDFEDRSGPIPIARTMNAVSLLRQDRLYIILQKALPAEKSEKNGVSKPSRSSNQSTVLLAFDLKREGKVVWRIDRSFAKLESLLGDRLIVSDATGKKFPIDVATGSPEY